jgi:hypothetical protein
MQIIDRNGRTRESDTLEDGERIRVGMTFMDSTQRSVARAGKAPLVVDAFGDADRLALSRPGYRYPVSRTAADVNRTLAYDQANADAEAAWRKGPVKPLPAGAYPSNGAKVGDICTINGAPGHLSGRRAAGCSTRRPRGRLARSATRG